MHEICLTGALGWCNSNKCKYKRNKEKCELLNSYMTNLITVSRLFETTMF